MIDIQLFVGCATCGWQQGCPREDLPPSALEGGACEAGGPGPRGGLLAASRAIPAKAALPASSDPASDDARAERSLAAAERFF